MLTKDKTAIVLAEFFGTFVLASAVLGMITKIGIPFFGALTAGATLALMVMIIGKVSGAHINPAVTFGLWSIRKITTSQAVVYVAAQMLGGLCAWKLGEYLLNQQLDKLANTAFDWRVLIAEAIGAFVFTFGIAAAISQKFEDGKLAGAIGVSLFCGIVIASMGSNGVLNPAVAMGINSYNINYLIGPLVGGLVGMNVYEYVFANPINKKQKSSAKKKK